MTDGRALARVIDEFLWTLRRGGLRIATSQAVDVVRAVDAVGFDDRFGVREAIAAVVVVRAADRRTYDALFDHFFGGARATTSLWERLAALGFIGHELDELRDLLARLAEGDPEGMQHLGALLARGAELDRLLYLAGVARALDAAHNPLQIGFFTHRVLHELAMPRAHEKLAALRSRLRDALGEERGNLLADALRDELDRAAEEVRAHVHAGVERRQRELADKEKHRRVDTTAFTSLSDREVEDVRHAVRRFAERLRGAERVRRKRARRGRIDPHKTLRRALKSGGVPFYPARKARRRDKPRLILLCDVSDSVRTVARFMLEFVYAAHELFDKTRSFVFVSELGETTALFAKEPVSVALGLAYGGGVISVADNSNYGRVLRTFGQLHLRAVDRRTTVVILGDGRTNYHDDASEILDRIRERARALLWFCPEDRGGWAIGDSAMPRYAPKCTGVYAVRNARELEDAARKLMTTR